MKRFLLKIVAIITLSCGIVFGSTLLPSAPLTESTYADENNATGEQQDDPRDHVNSADTKNETENENTDENTDRNTNGNTNENNNESSNENADEDTEEEPDEDTNVCEGEAGSISWALCPVLNAVSSFVDRIYDIINKLLVVQPLSTNHDSAVYNVWQKACEITNIIFVIFILVVIYSQITGFGVSNYGIKRVLPRIIVAVIMVNLSFFICSILVDLSNIVGSSLVQFFTDIQISIQPEDDPFSDISWRQLFGGFTGGTAVGFVAVAAMGGIGAAFWMFVIALLGAAISVIIGLLTISLRQGVVLVLIMISPLAFVAYLLPNTEKWFQKWKSLLAQMLCFYPLFSLLYGASKLAGWAIISTANKNAFFILLGFAVQVMPLFLSISLLKMSNTILGGVSSALERIVNPINAAAARWGASHAELNRRKHLANNRLLTGARLQNYLAYRQQLRDLDTEDLKNIAGGRNLARAYKHRSSSKGTGADGKDVWGVRPNRSTQIAKEAGLQSTITAAAQQNFTNTLGEYGDIFKNETAKALGDAHAQAYLDVMRQNFRAENIAQGDQAFLLGSYLDAVKKEKRNPFEYNRLIGGATGKLGHAGETTIMGQVIKRSAEIEDRRRTEARIVTTKFGVDKGAYRGMLLDKAQVNDDGFEVDENGEVIEDSQYRYRHPKTGKDTTARHRDWGQYIAVHKTTRAEISKEEYDALDPSARSQYNKIKYMEIKDDDGDVVQKVYEDDAGYMKEMLRKDIAIGDPINRRYATEIGLKLPDSEIARLQLKYPDIDWSKVNDINKSGKLRRYHSTVAGALQESRYSEHAGEFTAMLIAQLDRGYILDAGQRNIAGLDSMIKAAKTGKLFQNDAIITQDWERIVKCLDPDAPDGERFKDYFPDISIALSRNINGFEPKGLRHSLDEHGRLTWREIPRNDPSMTSEDIRNWIKHRMIPDFATKVVGAANRKLSPEIMNSLKPDAVDAFLSLINTIGELSIKNIDPDPSIPFDERLNPGMDILRNSNPDEIQKAVENWKRIQKDVINQNGGGTTSGSTGGNGGGGGSTGSSGGGTTGGSGSSTSGGGGTTNSSNSKNFGGTNGFNRDLRAAAYDDAYNVSYDTVVHDIQDLFSDLSSDFASVSQAILTYFSNHKPLSDPDIYHQLENAISAIQFDDRYYNTYDAINSITDLNRDRELVDDLYQQVVDIVNQAYGRS